jgi:hypothetical protein
MQLLDSVRWLLVTSQAAKSSEKTKIFFHLFSCLPAPAWYLSPVMNAMQLFNAIGNRQKGAFATVTTFRAAKCRKGSPLVEKRSTSQMRLGHSYENQASTKEAREEGREKMDADKLWHEPATDIDGNRNLLRRHKTTGQLYLVGQSTGNRPVTVWYRDGVEVAKEEIEDFLLASEKSDGTTPDYTFHKLENVEAVA